MPRPLRAPSADDVPMFEAISELSDRIERGQREIHLASRQRRRIVVTLTEQGWSMYGIARVLNVPASRINRIMKDRDGNND